MEDEEKIRLLEDRIKYLEKKVDKTEYISRSVQLGALKARALKSGVPFEIHHTDLEWVETCPILGIILERNTLKGDRSTSPSVDRLIPEKGYIKGNVRVISKLANSMKSNATRGELEIFAKNILDYVDGKI